MAYDDQNIFARILKGEIPCDRVYENDHALAFRDIQPQAPVHVLVIPKGPYVNMDDFSAKASNAEMADFTRAIGDVARQLGVVDTGFRTIANNGPDAHQEVQHLHVHILAGRDLGGMLKRFKG